MKGEREKGYVKGKKYGCEESRLEARVVGKDTKGNKDDKEEWKEEEEGKEGMHERREPGNEYIRKQPKIRGRRMGR